MWSQIIIKETGGDVELLNRTPRTGIYRLTGDGTAEFNRWGYDWHWIADESEAFYLRIQGPGRLPLPGCGPGSAGDPRAPADR